MAYTAKVTSVCTHIVYLHFDVAPDSRIHSFQLISSTPSAFTSCMQCSPVSLFQSLIKSTLYIVVPINAGYICGVHSNRTFLEYLWVNSTGHTCQDTEHAQNSAGSETPKGSTRIKYLWFKETVQWH